MVCPRLALTTYGAKVQRWGAAMYTHVSRRPSFLSRGSVRPAIHPFLDAAGRAATVQMRHSVSRVSCRRARLGPDHRFCNRVPRPVAAAREGPLHSLLRDRRALTAFPDRLASKQAAGADRTSEEAAAVKRQRSEVSRGESVALMFASVSRHALGAGGLLARAPSANNLSSSSSSFGVRGWKSWFAAGSCCRATRLPLRMNGFKEYILK
jgi:hypothetical protein